MTRRPKKRLLPERSDSERSEQTASAAGNRRAAGRMRQVRMPSSLPVICGLLLAAVLIVFGQTIRYDFVNFDDYEYVCENWHVSGGLTAAGIAWAFTDTHVSAHWHPLTWLSLMADAQVFGSKEGPPDRARLAAGMHVVNVALHAANAVVLFLVLRVLTASLWRSALVAALFAVHPLHVESVAWITERKDVLSGLFGLLAVWAYAWYARGPSVARYLSVAAALTLGLMAKPMLVTWPFLFLLLDYWPLGRTAGMREKGLGIRDKGLETRGARHGLSSLISHPSSLSPPLRLVVEKIPLFLLAAASAAVTFLTQRSGGTVTSLEAVPICQRIARAAVLYVAYLGKTVWPVNLAAVYPSGTMDSYLPALGAGLLLALLTAGALWGAWRGQRWLAVGWLWFLGTLLPTIGLVQVGLVVMADRFLYLPQIGIGVALVWGMAHLASPWPYRRWPLATVSALVLAGLMACAWQQTSYWQNSRRLWNRVLACTANNDFAHNSLGQVLADGGNVDEAMAHYRTALEINPDCVAAHNNLGIALAGRGQVDEAIAHYRTALEIKPDFASAHNNLGTVLRGRGQVDQAAAHYRRALEIEPDYAEAHNNFGALLAGCGQVDEAIAHYRKALEVKPNYAEARNNLAAALTGCGQVDEAIAQYRRALEIKPDYAEAHNNLGAALAGRGQLDEAIAHYRRALEIKPDFIAAHLSLGNALAGAPGGAPSGAPSTLGRGPGRGQIDEAISHFQQALDLASARNDRAMADSIRARIKLLQSAAHAGNAP